MDNIRQIHHYLHNRLIDIMLPIIVGLVCGFAAVIIKTIIPLVFSWVMMLVSLSGRLGFLTISAFLLVGADISVILIAKMKATSGVGLDISIRNYHRSAGLMPTSFVPLKFLATLFTLGFGGSGGLVGPTSSIGHGIASYFSKAFRLSKDNSKMLALCGISACVSALLHTPFGATIFGLELCYIDGLIYSDLIPVLASSISAYIVSSRIIMMLPLGYLFHKPYLSATMNSESAFPWHLNYLAYCVIAALVTAVLGIAFIRSFQTLQRFNRKKLQTSYGPIVGALTIGLVSVIFFRHRLPDFLGEPSRLVENCIAQGYPICIAIALLIGRWVNTLLTVGFGGSGGLFSPTLLLGGLAGNIVALLLGVSETKVLVATGMAAALSGVLNVPIAAIIIIIEIFGVDYIIPAAIGSSIAFMIARRWVIYPHVKHIGSE